MFTTDAVFHWLTSLLKPELKSKSWYMLLTPAVFQSPIGPYVVAAVAGLVVHALTAVATLSFVMHTP